MRRIFRQRTIYSPDAPDDPYLDRWTLFSCRWFQVLLHRFHRSDNAAVHDHPWSFVSLVLWRGYREELHARRFVETADGHDARWRTEEPWRSRRLPLSLAFRRAEDRHRVVLLPAFKTRELIVPSSPLPAWTLVVTGPRRREWFFYPRGVRVPWRVMTEFGEAMVDQQVAAGAREAYFEELDRLLRAEEAKRATPAPQRA